MPSPNGEDDMRLSDLIAPALIFAFVTSAAPSHAQERDHVKAPATRPQNVRPAPAVKSTAVPATPTAKAAQDFVARVEADLVGENEHSNRVEWISANFITDDTNWLASKAAAEAAARAVTRAKTA